MVKEEEGLPSPQRQHSLKDQREEEEEEGGGKQRRRRNKNTNISSSAGLFCFFVPPLFELQFNNVHWQIHAKVNTWNYTWRVTSVICASIKKYEGVTKQTGRLGVVGWWGAGKGANMNENPSKISNRNVLDLGVSRASCHWLARFGENTLKKRSYAARCNNKILHVYAAGQEGQCGQRLAARVSGILAPS